MAGEGEDGLTVATLRIEALADVTLVVDVAKVGDDDQLLGSV
jgi:hypothetical protein